MATPGENGSKFGRIAVYCGASDGGRPEYVDAAVAMGEEMCRRGIKLVYGGGTHYMQLLSIFIYLAVSDFFPETLFGLGTSG